MAAEASPPPPPPPPDLNAVYRPDNDALVRHSIAAPLEEAPEERGPVTFEEVLGLAPPPPAPAPRPKVSEEESFEDVLGLRPQAPAPRPKVSEEESFEDVLGLRPQTRAAASSASPLLDLLDSAPPPAQEGGLLAHLPQGVTPSSLAKPAAMIDLSGQKAEEPPVAGAAGSTAAPGHAGPAAKPPLAAKPAKPEQPARPARPIPAGATGFGSEDLFGNGSQEKTIKDEAVAAISSVYGMLPDQVKDQAKPYIPNCIETSNQDDSTEAVFSARPGTEGAAGPGVAPATPLEAQHTQVAVDRACNGKWVPTYMRQQLAANGHTTLPSAPNAHEHAATAPPASLGQAFADMGEELGDSAQTMLTFMLAFLSSLATQCQMCTHQAASTVHEQVIAYGENLCSAEGQLDQSEDRVMMGRPLNEAAAGLGPVRSQLRHHLEVSFARLVEIVKRKLVTPFAPPDFQQAVKARELSREISVHDVPVEDWLFSTELHKTVLPEAALPHLCRDALGSLTCYETWHVETQEERAEVEISSAPSGGAVTAVLRIIIAGKPAAEGGGCDVESRLFVRPQEHGAALPLGLVDGLLQVHQAYAESLRGSVLALSREMGSENLPEPAAVQDNEPLPVVQLTLPEKRAPSWAADDGAPGKRATPPRLESNGDGIDASLLMKMAEGI